MGHRWYPVLDVSLNALGRVSLKHLLQFSAPGQTFKLDFYEPTSTLHGSALSGPEMRSC